MNLFELALDLQVWRVEIWGRNFGNIQIGRKTQSWELQEGSSFNIVVTWGSGLFVVVKLTQPFLSKLPKGNF